MRIVTKRFTVTDRLWADFPSHLNCATHLGLGNNYSASHTLIPPILLSAVAIQFLNARCRAAVLLDAMPCIPMRLVLWRSVTRAP